MWWSKLFNTSCACTATKHSLFLSIVLPLSQSLPVLLPFPSSKNPLAATVHSVIDMAYVRTPAPILVSLAGRTDIMKQTSLGENLVEESCCHCGNNLTTMSICSFSLTFDNIMSLSLNSIVDLPIFKLNYLFIYFWALYRLLHDMDC